MITFSLFSIVIAAIFLAGLMIVFLIFYYLKNKSSQNRINDLQTKQRNFNNAINSIIKTTAENSEENKIFQSMVEILGNTLNVDRALIYDIDLHSFFASALCEWKKEEIPSSKASYSLTIFRNVLEYFLIEKKWFSSHKNNINPIITKDHASELIHNKMQIKSLIWYPFFFQTDRFFLLILNTISSFRNWDDDEIHFMESVANQVIVALQKTRLVNEIEEREKKLIWEQNLSNSGPVVIFRFLIKDHDWPMEYVSKNIESEFGYKAFDFMEGNITLGMIMVKEDRYRITKNTWVNIKNSNRETFEHEYRILDKAGNLRWVYAFNRIIRNPRGIATHFHGYVYDITERKIAEDLLAQEKEKLQVTLHSIGDAVITTDIKGKIDFMNPIAELLTGWSLELSQGQPIENIMVLINENTRNKIPNPVDICLKTGKMTGLDSSTLLVKKNGVELPIQDTISPIRDNSGTIIGAIIVFHDVIQAKELEWHSTHDVLTGMLNRKEFEKKTESALESSYIYGTPHALLYIDLDQFKIINDTCGHSAGDKLLQKLSIQLYDLIPESDTIARLGGDEFGILLHNVEITMAREVGEKIRNVIKSSRFHWEGKNFDIAVSIGIVPINKFNHSVSEILGSADIACYTAKDLGRNRIHVFDSNDEYMMQKHGEMQWVSRLNRAFEENRFVLLKQSIKPASENDSINHYEILLRLKDDDGSLITPDNFIPAAERYNLMYEIDKWVINSSFSQIKKNPSYETCKNGLYCINLSGTTLSEPGLLDFILSQTKIYQIDPSRFCFEITETSAIANLVQTKYLMTALKEIGFLFALDDFGTGVSSFGYLKNLSVDFIKIDGSFIKDMLKHPTDLAMVESINQIGHVMNLKTIAEFAETEELVKKLIEIGVDYIQGFAIDRPTPLNIANFVN